MKEEKDLLEDAIDKITKELLLGLEKGESEELNSAYEIYRYEGDFGFSWDDDEDDEEADMIVLIEIKSEEEIMVVMHTDGENIVLESSEN